MEFTGIQQVHKEFFNLFLADALKDFLTRGKEPSYFLSLRNYLGDRVKVQLRYFNRGSYSGLEETSLYYPTFTIQDFAPTPDKSRALFVQNYIVGNYEPQPIPTPYNPYGEPTADFVFFPIPMNFMYQVSAIADNPNDYEAMLMWLNTKFDLEKNEASFLMNVTKTSQGDLGAVVPYSVVVNDIVRTDNRYESTYLFTLKTYVHLRLPVTDSVISQIYVSLAQNGLPEEQLVPIIEKFAVQLGNQ